MTKLIDFLTSESKHGLYQSLPPELLKINTKYNKFSYTGRFDKERYNWFSKTINFNNKKVVDIGGNVGYFSFRLNNEYNTNNIIYELNKLHIKAIDLIKKELNIDTNLFNSKNEGIALNDIDKLPNLDVILLFNVLHHAGDDFENGIVNSIKDWKDYAIKYLTKLAEKSEFLIYQSGQTWTGHRDSFCDDKDMISYHKSILEKSNWEVINIGVVNKINNVKYTSYNFNLHTKYPLISNYSYLKKGIAHYTKHKLNDYKFLIRPIFVCKKKI